MRWPAFGAVLCAAQLAAAAEPEEPKPSDVLKPEGLAEIPSPITDRFALRGTYFSSSIDTEIRLDDPNGTLGTELSAEDDLDMRENLDQGRVEMMLRMRDRSRVRFDYFKLTRQGDEVLNRPVRFGDETFDTDERVLSLLDWRTLNFTYLYSVVRNSRFEVGAGLGLHIFNGEARARVPARLIAEEESGVAPFPTLALDGTWRISSRFALTGRINHLSADVEDSSGEVSDYHADLQYRWRPNFALGVGYTRLKTKLAIADSDFPGRFVFDVKGPELFLRASF